MYESISKSLQKCFFLFKVFLSSKSVFKIFFKIVFPLQKNIPLSKKDVFLLQRMWKCCKLQLLMFLFAKVVSPRWPLKYKHNQVMMMMMTIMMMMIMMMLMTLMLIMMMIMTVTLIMMKIIMMMMTMMMMIIMMMMMTMIIMMMLITMTLIMMTMITMTMMMSPCITRIARGMFLQQVERLVSSSQHFR